MQWRFYVAKDQNGSAFEPRTAIEDGGYRKTGDSGKLGLRGRKVYPHHAGLPQDYWNVEGVTHSDERVRNRYREYFRQWPNHRSGSSKGKHDSESRDSQNRSITQWVRPGEQFRFDLHFDNLDKVELGALIWLLRRDGDQFFHRLGGGKPLGFGSVRLSLRTEQCRLFSQSPRYRSLNTGSAESSETVSATLRDLEKAFEDRLESDYGDRKPPFVRALLKSGQGWDGPNARPIHYPRVAEEGSHAPGEHPRPLVNGENFKWFQENEKGSQFPLPDLADSDVSLPIHRPAARGPRK